MSVNAKKLVTVIVLELLATWYRTPRLAQFVVEPYSWRLLGLEPQKTQIRFMRTFYGLDGREEGAGAIGGY
jgi:hypothetical protein